MIDFSVQNVRTLFIKKKLLMVTFLFLSSCSVSTQTPGHQVKNQETVIDRSGVKEDTTMKDKEFETMLEIDQTQAIKISKKEAERLQYGTWGRNMYVNENPTSWDSIRVQPMDMKLAFKPEFSKTLDGKKIWAIYYWGIAGISEPFGVGGDFLVLVDAISGKILLSQLGK